MEKKLQQLIDVSEIKNVQLNYCRAVDRLDFGLMRDCFHADAVYDHPLREVCTIDEWIEWCQPLKDYECTSTFSGNQLVTVDGSIAWAEQYLLAFHRIPPKDGQPAIDWTVNCRYIDKMECRNSEWRIIHRRYVLDSERTDPVGDYMLVPADLRRSKRDKTDLSYLR